jgi:hypothetical protein
MPQILKILLSVFHSSQCLGALLSSNMLHDNIYTASIWTVKVWYICNLILRYAVLPHNSQQYFTPLGCDSGFNSILQYLLTYVPFICYLLFALCCLRNAAYLTVGQRKFDYENLKKFDNFI